MVDIIGYSEPLQEAVLDLILSIQRDEFGFDILAADQPDLLDIPGFYQTGSGQFWVAVSQGEVVGTIALRDLGHREGALRKMFVKASHRGADLGVAAHLLDRLVQSAEACGLRTLYLGTTEAFRAAHRFYEKHGWQRIGPDQLPAAFPRMALDTRFYRRVLEARRALSKPGEAVQVERLSTADLDRARALFTLMAGAFGEPHDRLDDSYLERLLGREDFWALAAKEGGCLVGGLTAHTLPMTRAATSELFIYDLAVREDRRRRGIGSALMKALMAAASTRGIREIFVPADQGDDHALAFYQSLGGVPAQATFFTFRTR